ncbi:MAG TPA: AMP-binding protein [Solirubrobacter sp.]|nr:AMP-binding protein [Solirubrobacter sp.]
MIRGPLVDGETGEAVPLAARIRHVAGALAARGFSPGDVLALWAPNIPPWAGVAFGAMTAGGAVTGIHPAATDRDVAAQVETSGASVLVTVPEFADRAPGALVIGPELLSLPTADVPPPPDPDALALLPFSSGTTGLPKGVMLTHRNLVAAIGQIELALGLTERDVVLAVPPFCHMMGFVVTLAAPLAAGATVVTLPRWDEAAIDRYGVTVLAVPPPLMMALARSPHDHPSLELIVSGGAPVSAELQEAVAARFPHAAVAQGYGMTETSVAIAGPDRRRPTPPGSVGRPMHGTEVKLVDGELWVRGPQVMAGYLNAPTDDLRADGWLRTGDLARMDADGNLYIVDRIKELIKVNALAVSPAELEALLLEHPLVADAAVAGRPDPRTGEVPVAFVVPRGDLEPDALIAWAAERVAPHKRLADVTLVDAIPRTPSGKIIRRALAAPPPPPAPALRR